ncbi:MAG: hypothetical protein WBX15_15760 [Thermoanaerobaculia bacterium]
MNHLTEEQLVLHHYGESTARERSDAETHLFECRECGSALTNLESFFRDLGAPVPEPAPDFEERLWERLRWRLRRDERPGGSGWRWLAVAAVFALAVSLGVLVMTRNGEVRNGSPTANAVPAPVSPQARERVFVAVVADHIDHSEITLMEMVNGNSGESVQAAQTQARDLIAANRIYRQAAASSGDATVADVLDQLEPILLEIAHGPANPDPAQLTSLRRRMEEKGILFKLRVVGKEMREREKAAVHTNQKSL